MTDRIPTSPGDVVLLGTVQGLASEADVVREAIARIRPVAVALGIPPTSAADLAGYTPDPEDDPFLDMMEHDAAYSIHLEKFGAIDLPPPDLMEAIRVARALDIPVHGVDLDQDAYDDAFTREVSTLGFLHMGHVHRKLSKRPPQAADARAFSLAWDKAVRRVAGIDRVERLREETMAKNTAALARELAGTVLLVLELPREAGVRAALTGGSVSQEG